MRYSIVTGYWSETQERADFFKLWWNHNYDNFKDAEDVFVINSNSSVMPTEKLGKWIDLSFNPGHAHDLDHSNLFPKKLGGWSACFILGALTCYFSNKDLVFLEQDTLLFGDCISKLYKELEDSGAKMLVGRPQDADGQYLAQSFFVIKHEFILEFVTAYMALNANDGGDGYMRTETKFSYLKEYLFKDKIQYMSFGYDRAEPSDYNEEIFYMQHFTEDKFKSLKSVGKINEDANFI